MNTVMFLNESTDMPRSIEVKEMTLPVPHPGMNEYRRYFNHRIIEQEKTEEDSEQHVTEEIPCADFVAVQADHEPTNEEWREILSENGYSEERITLILSKE